jgi:hypothetical protein
MTFYSIGGMAPSGGEGKMNARASPPASHRSRDELAADPRYSEYFDAVNANPDLLVQETGVEGFHKFRGDAALVHAEERDGRGVITQEIQRSDPNGSGTYHARWEPTAPGRLTMTDVKRVHE